MKRFALLLIAILAPFSLVFASVTGSVSGTVTDASGAVIPGVSVSALNTQTGITQTVTTDSRGFYAFPSLAVGYYEIDARQKGFRDYRQTGLVIDVNTELRVDVTLQVGQTTQEVTVSSTAVHVETERTEMGEVITASHMTAMPLNGRGYTDLMALQPGVVPVSTGE